MSGSIRYVSCAGGSPDLFATALFEKHVTIWSLFKREKVREIKTIMDAGGKRLLLIQKPIPLLIAGAYNRQGICAYDPFTGGLLWRRKDLTRVQELSMGKFEDDKVFLSVIIDSRPCHLLDIHTGNTISTFRGIVEIYPSRVLPTAIMADKTYIKYYSFKSNSIHWKTSKMGFAILDCHIGDSYIVISEVVGLDYHIGDSQIVIPEVGAYVRCFDQSGNMLWKWNCPKGYNILKIMWDENTGHWFGNMFKYDCDVRYKVVKFDVQGNAEILFEIFNNYGCGFFENSSIIASENGAVINVETGEILWVFEPNAKRKSGMNDYIVKI